MWDYAQTIADDDEGPDPTPPSFKKISPEKVEKVVRQIEKIIKNNPKASSKAKAKLSYIKKNFWKGGPSTLNRFLIILNTTETSIYLPHEDSKK